ncbi:hypothetical protein P3T29_005959 [Kitasatospora sp. MAP5-34]|nr:hypothetical protein [Kitasatospora sp. MAP5-34]
MHFDRAAVSVGEGGVSRIERREGRAAVDGQAQARDAALSAPARRAEPDDRAAGEVGGVVLGPLTCRSAAWSGPRLWWKRQHSSTCDECSTGKVTRTGVRWVIGPPRWFRCGEP